jgi:hypothetical protein
MWIGDPLAVLVHLVRDHPLTRNDQGTLVSGRFDEAVHPAFETETVDEEDIGICDGCRI